MSAVLIVDDDLDVCEAYAEVLREAGYDIMTAHNGREALDLLRASVRKPDLVLIDLMMPIMDGRQLQLELAADEQLRTIPFVVMTAERHRTTFDETEYIQKPVSLEALLEAVARRTGEGTR